MISFVTRDSKNALNSVRHTGEFLQCAGLPLEDIGGLPKRLIPAL